MPDDDAALFEWGVTTADEGTGFGLAIVRSIAEAHGWRVRARTAESGGARFEVVTPGSDCGGDGVEADG